MMLHYENKTSKCYEDTLIYYNIIVVNLLYVLVTFCGHLQGGVVLGGIHYRDN